MAKLNEPAPKARRMSVPTQPAEESEFDRFEDLTEKLLHVPKKELDEKLSES